MSSGMVVKFDLKADSTEFLRDVLAAIQTELKLRKCRSDVEESVERLNDYKKEVS